MSDPDRKRLLVEGNDDVYSVVELMRPSVDWTATKKPVQIEECRGARLMDDDTIPLRLRATDIDILGILIDANGSCQRRWQRVAQLSGKYVVNLPSAIPASGFISQTSRGTKFGVWIMPDNKNQGMLEDFLQSLIPDGNRPLLRYAELAAAEARKHGATYSDEHVPKAILHTWLSWLNPPGRPFGSAFKENFFNASAPAASAFQHWFRELYVIRAIENRESSCFFSVLAVPGTVPSLAASSTRLHLRFGLRWPRLEAAHTTILRSAAPARLFSGGASGTLYTSSTLYRSRLAALLVHRHLC